MLTVLAALGIASASAGTPLAPAAAAFFPCHPDKHTACLNHAPARSRNVAADGKRCHSDPTRSMGCTERAVRAEPRKEADVAAR